MATASAKPVPLPRHRRRTGTARRSGRAVVATGLAAAVLSAGGCGWFDDDELAMTEDGFAIEPAEDVGPDAFTPPVTADDAICDKDKLVRELQSRPEALREYARVLGLAPDRVPVYVASLTPVVLAKDTKVTNHGLRNGQAYARPAVMVTGTAVLVERDQIGAGTTSTVATGTATTAPAGGQPVTRCKCGNPLLPPPAPGTTATVPPATAAPGTAGTTAPGTTVTGTTERGTGPAVARTTTSVSGATTTTGSATTTTTGSATTTMRATTTGTPLS